MPLSAASVAASRRTWSRSGSRLATPANPSSNTVTPSGRAPSASVTAPPASVVPPCSSRRASLNEGADDAAGRWTKIPMIAAVTTNRPTAVGLVVLWVIVLADAVRLMLPVKAAWCCRHVCGFRYADDMHRLVASSSGAGRSWSGSVTRSVGAVLWPSGAFSHPGRQARPASVEERGIAAAEVGLPHLPCRRRRPAVDLAEAASQRRK